MFLSINFDETIFQEQELILSETFIGKILAEEDTDLADSFLGRVLGSDGDEEELEEKKKEVAVRTVKVKLTLEILSCSFPHKQKTVKS